MRLGADFVLVCVPQQGWPHKWTSVGQSGWQSYLDVTLGDNNCMYARLASEVVTGAKAIVLGGASRSRQTCIVYESTQAEITGGY